VPLSAHDLEIMELESRLHTQDQVIAHLTAEARKPWWRAMGSTASRLLWRARAKALGKRNRDLRWERYASDMVIHETVDALLEIHTIARGMEWEPFEGSRTMMICRECNAMKSGWSVIPPQHQEGCRVGMILEVAEKAVRFGALRLNQDGKRMMEA
jgi:hypothetical protein